MKIAVRQCDITPERPCWQGGYVQREHFFEKVHDPITATIMVITTEDGRLVTGSMDVSGVDQNLTDLICEQVRKQGIELNEENLILSATHTHSGPLVGAYMDRTIDSQYLQSVVRSLSSAIVEAWQEEGTEVELRYRSTWIDGLYSNRNDPNKHSDKWIHQLGFFQGEQMKAMICSLAHHCTVLGPNFMECSADLFGEMRSLLQEETQVPVMMVQGNAGDMGNKQYRRSNLFDEVQRQAANLIDQIHKKHSPWQPLQVRHLCFRKVVFQASYDVDVEVFKAKKAEFEKQLETETQFDTVKLLVTGIKSFERKIAQGSRHVEREMSCRIIRMDDLQIVAVPGELGSILGLRIKAASPAQVCLLWGYANPGDLGYMIEKEAYGGFSQESNVTDYPAGIPDEFVERIIAAL